jgi:ABC-2 type transport system ATP-binding protein
MRVIAPTSGVSVRGACYSYGPRTVLHDVDLELRSGEIYGLLGPNGAGKTTLMKAISGYLLLTRGTVRIDDRDPFTDVEARRAVSYIPQNIAIFPHLTVAENLEVFGRLAGVPAAKVKSTVAEIVDKAALADYVDSPCGILSGGYQRRVNICAGLLSKPRAIILDEPTVGIDIDARESIHALLRALRDAGTTILLATHDLDQAQQLANRVGMLKGGRMVLEGPPSDLIDQHFGQDQEVVVVLGTPPSEAKAQLLRSIGMRQTQSPLTWFGFMMPDCIDVRAMRAKFAASGLVVREIRVRTPDLNSLFLEVLGTPENRR